MESNVDLKNRLLPAMDTSWFSLMTDEGIVEGHEQGLQEGIEERDKYFLNLLDQGLSIEELKQRLTQTD